MSTDFLKYLIYITVALFVVIIIAYLALRKKMGHSEYSQIKKLRKGTKANKYSFEILYQKLYITYSKIPYIKMYLKMFLLHIQEGSQSGEKSQIQNLGL